MENFWQANDGAKALPGRQSDLQAKTDTAGANSFKNRSGRSDASKKSFSDVAISVKKYSRKRNK